MFNHSVSIYFRGRRKCEPGLGPEHGFGYSGLQSLLRHRSRSYQNEIPTGTNLTAAVSGLADGTTYYFSVTAVDASGLESDFSDEVAYSVPQTNQAPTISAIQNQVTAIGQSTTAIPFTISDSQT